MNSMMLVTLFGPKDINALSVMGELADAHSATLMDVQQTRTTKRYSLHVLLSISVSDERSNEYHRLFDGLSAAIRSYAEDNACEVSIDSVLARDTTCSAQPVCRLLLAGRKVSLTDIAAVSEVASTFKLPFETIQWLSGGGAATGNETRGDMTQQRGDSFSVVECLSSSTPSDEKSLRHVLLQLSQERQIDIHLQENSYDSRHRRLVCFDMDSTLIDAEVIDELAKEIGVGEQVAEITESAMRGDIAFDESFRRRMALLEGLDESVLATIANRLSLNPGVESLFINLNKRGYKTAILSGGFDYFAQFLQKKLGVDYVYANKLEIVGGKVTGRVTGEIVNGERKAELLTMLADKEDVRLSEVVAVGDGANDLLMLDKAGMGVAFRAKPRVKAAAKYNISHLGLDSMLYLMGFNATDIE